MELGALLTLFFVLFDHLVPLLSAQQYDQSKLTCPETFECRELGRLGFPFTNNSQPDCGLSLVDCNSQPFPKLQLSPFSVQTFYAINMSLQSNSRILLRDPVLESLLSNKSCQSFFHQINLPHSSSISFSIVLPLTLLRCPKVPELTNEARGFFNWSGLSYEMCQEFNVYYGRSISQNPPNNCQMIKLPWSWINPFRNDDLFNILTADFYLEWHVSDRCYFDCHLRGGKCQTDPMNNFICANAAQGQGRRGLILGTVVCSCGAVVAMLAIFVFFYRRNKSSCSMGFFYGKRQKYHDIETFLRNYGSLAPKRYRYSEVKKMTNSFKTKLGKGGYSCVYKGKLPDGTVAAVKVLKESKGNGKEFINEVASISRTSHVNIVALLGFCFQDDKKALIYEFMPNGSLEKFIYDEKSSVEHNLGWQTLYNIALGIARGLEYLHRGCSTRILHFDIKPHNILLDEDFCPKISDFGLAKLCPRKESIISTIGARGTIGYIAPEVFCKTIGRVSHKSDVYSYGMMVLEMVGGRKNVDVEVDESSEIYFPHWIYTRLVQGEELSLSRTVNEEENKYARKMLIVSLWCIQTDPSSRPAMGKVVEMLEGNLEALQIPPKPFLSSPDRASQSDATTSHITQFL